VEIKTRKQFNEIIKSLTEELVEEEDLDETTGTGNVAGYNTPFAFGSKTKKDKKKNKEISTNSTGYNVVNEALDEKDLNKIKKLIRSVVADVLRDIWLKRTSWK
tara:strand:- start:767 stop:1078 length:312 start_codon:yes stop_codon:yes gene_type:complete